ncbi:hypothetical protein HZS_1071, partial [Henneguya salminicola]
MSDRNGEGRKKQKNTEKVNALERIRKFRKTGEKCKYEFEEEPSVYSYVDDETYAKELKKQTDTSWIVDGVIEDEEEDISMEKKSNLIQNIPLPTNHLVAPLNNFFTRKPKPNNSNNFKNALEEIENDQLLDDILKSLNPNNENQKKLSENSSQRVEDSPIKNEPKKIQEAVLPASTPKFNRQLPWIGETIKKDFKIPSFDFSDLSNGFSDIEAQAISESFNLSTISNDQSLNKSLNSNIISIPVNKIDGNNIVKFYWLDISESKNFSNSVFLFGKIRSDRNFINCMLHVRNVPSQFYILTRSNFTSSDGKEGEQITFMHVYKEISSLLEKCGIMKFECRAVKLLYPFFGNESPDMLYDFLEILCQGGHKIPDNLSGTTFSHVFGLKKSLAEYFILSTKIKGPCWLEIKNPYSASNKISYCPLEIDVDSIDFLTIDSEQLGPPPLVATSLSILTNGITAAHQIIGISLVTVSGVSLESQSNIAPSSIVSTSFILCPPYNGCGVPSDFIEYTKERGVSVDITSSERSLLTLLFTKLSLADPDVLVGHDIFEYIFKIIIHAAAGQNVGIWSRLGRFKQTKIPKNSKIHDGMPIYCGRLVVELKSLSEELVKYSSYDMTELCKQVLDVNRTSNDWVNINHYFTKSPKLLGLIQSSMNDAFYCIKIMDRLNILPLFKQISSICGHPLGRALVLGRAERIEYLLLHGFTDSNCVCPDKWKKNNHNKLNAQMSGVNEEDLTKRKAAYGGGLVLEPRSGFYPDYILLLDYMSLYPSLIQEFNICFTTMKLAMVGNIITAIPIEGSEKGVLPKEIKKLVERRRQVKSILQSASPSSTEYIQLEIRQRALKLIANSIYGCLGYVNSRFYAKPLAALITSKGRELLNCTKDIVEGGMGFSVIYGDTDSIMVNTKTDDYVKIKEISQKIINAVNRNYHHLKIELDGVFRPMLLLKKKKYAAMSITMGQDGIPIKKKEVKGLDIIRHDWSMLAKESGSDILDLILSVTNHDNLIDKIQEYLMALNDKLNQNSIEIEKFIIKKNLTKRIEEYGDKKSQSHLLVAHRLISQGKKITIGDTIDYIVCLDGTTNSHIQRGYHLSEIQAKGYQIDLKYYKESQIFPVISRICQQIDGLDSSTLSRCLGFSFYKPIESNKHQSNPEDIELLEVSCDKCSNKWTFEWVTNQNNFTKSGLICKCKESVNFGRLVNQIEQIIYRHCRDYYRNVLICTDVTCETETSCLTLSSYVSNYKCICGKKNGIIRFRAAVHGTALQEGSGWV